jgi:hypothetical protein
MDRHSFTVEITGDVLRDPHCEDVLYEAGCSDALIAVVDGRMMVDFDRYATSYESAVASAVRDLQRAGATIGDITPLSD